LSAKGATFSSLGREPQEKMKKKPLERQRRGIVRLQARYIAPSELQSFFHPFLGLTPQAGECRRLAAGDLFSVHSGCEALTIFNIIFIYGLIQACGNIQ